MTYEGEIACKALANEPFKCIILTSSPQKRAAKKLMNALN